jgi:hypothetical protein
MQISSLYTFQYLGKRNLHKIFAHVLALDLIQVILFAFLK